MKIDQRVGIENGIRLSWIAAIFIIIIICDAFIPLGIARRASGHLGDEIMCQDITIGDYGGDGNTMAATSSSDLGVTTEEKSEDEEAVKEELKEDSSEEENPSPSFLLLVLTVGVIMLLFSLEERKKPKSKPRNESDERS